MYSQGLYEESDDGRRLGQPRTDLERQQQHLARYGTSELPKRGTGLSPYSLRGLTCQQAFSQARSEMGALYEPWYHASDAEIQQHICAVDSSLYPQPSAVRQTLCGSFTFPAPQPWPCTGGNGGNGGTDNNTLILGLAGIAVVGVAALAIASRGKKKVLVARIPKE